MGEFATAARRGVRREQVTPPGASTGPSGSACRPCEGLLLGAGRERLHVEQSPRACMPRGVLARLWAELLCSASRRWRSSVWRTQRRPAVSLRSTCTQWGMPEPIRGAHPQGDPDSQPPASVLAGPACRQGLRSGVNAGVRLRARRVRRPSLQRDVDCAVQRNVRDT